MIRRPPRSTLSSSSAASDVYKRQLYWNLMRGLLSTSGLRLAKSLNNVTLVGVVHDIQTGFVYEDAVTQFTLTTTSLDTTTSSGECAVEKDHHTIRCFGDTYSSDIKAKLKEGNVICVNGRLRMNPQLEPSCNKHFYFPFVHVQPPHGQVSVCLLYTSPSPRDS
eukprot:TRINITY_DN24036_c0_g1_i3.p1 TRINITY_DN24036_c0_g1~~TRINITY_DN24036_c0_g1_i3.p1  ORF type:complete len:164 (+),score=29.32 TRINITY_DN24036_c0_g1_i3:58-549(+)